MQRVQGGEEPSSSYIFDDLHSDFKVGVQLLEDEVNHDTSMENHEAICEPEEETAATSLEEPVALLNRGAEETSPPSHLDPHRSNMVMGGRSFLRGLQGDAFQTLMKCKKQELVWEKGSPHGRSTK